MRLPGRFDAWLLSGASTLSICVVVIACADGQAQLVVGTGAIDGGLSPDITLPEASRDDDSAAPDVNDAGDSPVTVGINATPGSDGEPTAAEVVGARLKVLAVGARGVVVRRGLRDLDAAAIAELGQEGGFYAQHEAELVFTLAVIDRAEDTRPSYLSDLPWDAVELREEMHLAIDNIASALGPSVRYLVIGRDIDVFLAKHPDERAAVEAFVIESIQYARGRLDAVWRVGAGFSNVGAALPDPSFKALLDASDVAALSYLPGLGGAQVEAPMAVTLDVAAMVTHADSKPIVLEAVGYPSSSAVGGSEEAQAQFMTSFFFDALLPRRDRFAFVNIEALFDVAPARCASRAAAQGEPPDGSYASYVCSLGLSKIEGTDKAAWPVFLQGAAVFASP